MILNQSDNFFYVLILLIFLKNYEFSWIVSNVPLCFKILRLCYLTSTENVQSFFPVFNQKQEKKSLAPPTIKRRLVKNTKATKTAIFKRWDKNRDVKLETNW